MLFEVSLCKAFVSATSTFTLPAVAFVVRNSRERYQNGYEKSFFLPRLRRACQSLLKCPSQLCLQQTASGGYTRA
jgi:hypothetical protein